MLTNYVQAVIEYLADLFTASPKEVFTRREILAVLIAVRNDPEILQVLRQAEGMEGAQEKPNLPATPGNWN